MRHAVLKLIVLLRQLGHSATTSPLTPSRPCLSLLDPPRGASRSRGVTLDVPHEVRHPVLKLVVLLRQLGHALALLRRPGPQPSSRGSSTQAPP